MTTRYPDLENKHVFITGGGSGIGASLVNIFLDQGCLVSSVSLEAEAQLPQAIRSSDNFFYHTGDVRDIPDLINTMQAAEEKFGAIHVLINNAANDKRHDFDEMTPQQWDDAINVNLKPYFFSAQQAAKSMKADNTGCIINLGSNCSLLGLTGYPAYVSAKAAVIGLTRAAARELGPNNIRVNALIPGWVMTERQKQEIATEEALKQCLSEQCLKETIQEEDIANTALFLASNASRMITGQSIVVDGGRALS